MNNLLNNPKKEGLWHFPWKYSESFIIALGILLLGFSIEVVSKGKVNINLYWPYNLFVGIAYISSLILVHIFFNNHLFVKWLSSIPACISSISLFCFMALLLGIIPQNERQLAIIIKYSGLSHVTRSWPFLLSQIYFLTTLGFVILRRASSINRKNIGFLLNHLGLWIVVSTALIGSGDLKRLIMSLKENDHFNQMAVDNYLRPYNLPFFVKLIDFDIEEYNPKIVIIDNKNNELITENRISEIELNKDLDFNIINWNIIVKELLPYSLPVEDRYEPSMNKGSAPACLISAINELTNDTVSGWITCGSFIIPLRSLRLDDKYSLVMKRPKSKKYSSLIELYTYNEFHDTIQIEVNKPISVKRWKLYQVGYDEKMGKWSDISIIELVRDPWLPVIYFGIFMLLAGAVYIFWIGKEIKD